MFRNYVSYLLRIRRPTLILNTRRGVAAVVLDEFIEVLLDGKWHSILEISDKLQLEEGEVRDIASFLSTYGFVKLDRDRTMVRIDEDAERLLP